MLEIESLSVLSVRVVASSISYDGGFGRDYVFG